MPPDDIPSGTDLLELVRRIDAVADRFEAAWRQPAAPDIADFLGTTSGDERPHVLAELVRIDLEHRFRHGQRPRLEDYLARWPDLPADLGAYHEQLARRYPEPALPPGTPTLPGLVIEALLGQGGFGVVYRARDARLGRTVAVKVPRVLGLLTPMERLTLLREARSAARLSHPGIVQVHEVRQDDLPCIVCEYIEGQTLARRLEQPPAPTVAQTVELVARVAETLHYAHQVGVVHRDVKPSNILLDAAGQPHLTDFGLALCRGHETLTEAGAPLGTLAYMSPEQAGGNAHQVDGRSDVYSLGVILHEMLAGQRPAGPERDLPSLPAHLATDLQMICRKAVARAVEERYQTAGDLADDLRRWQRDEPIRARPAGLPRQLRRWCRRHPGVAALSAVVVLLLVLSSLAGWLAWAASHAREEQRRREALLQQVQRIRLTQRTSGWSAEAWSLLESAAAIHRDREVQTQAAATLHGLDLVPWQRIRRQDASSLAFAPDGQYLLVGSSDRGPAVLWDVPAGAAARTGAAGQAGPVAFRRDGTALQLTAGRAGELLLRDPLGRGPTVRCRLPGPPPAPAAHALALAADGSLAAAAFAAPSRPGELAVWNDRGELLGRWPGEARRLCLAPGGRYLAGSDSNGQMVVWSIPDGRRLAAFRPACALLHCLAFSPDGRRLALGASDGTLGLWEWAAGLYQPCHGGEYDLFTLAFSPDGTLLVAGGRATHVWDALTGRLLLDLATGDFVRALVFSPDGTVVATASSTSGTVTLWRVQNGRGLRTLRGLTGPVSKVCLSPDGRRLAALGHRWQVGLWETSTGRLLHCHDVRPGLSADNAALAFSGDGARFAFCAGSEARLWEVDSGKELRRWPGLPPGLVDCLAFTSRGKLLLFRVETSDDRLPRFGDDPARFPRLCRLRDLASAQPMKPLATLPHFNVRVLSAQMAPDGSSLVVEGLLGTRQQPRQELHVLEGETASRRWHRPIASTSSAAWLVLDPTGRTLLRHVQNEEQPRSEIWDLATGERLHGLGALPHALGPGGEQYLVKGPSPGGVHPGLTLVRRRDQAALVVLGIDSPPALPATFDRTGRLAAWGNGDGTVTLCDLQEVRERLNEVRLGW